MPESNDPERFLVDEQAATPGIVTVLFTVLDPEGYSIQLDSERWKHIIDGHPEMKGHKELLKETLKLPEIIQRESNQSETHYYYRLTGRSKTNAQDIYLNAVVVRSQSEKTGRVKTAFLVKTIRKQGDLVWMNVRRS